jgi:hypothetical protein
VPEISPFEIRKDYTGSTLDDPGRMQETKSKAYKYMMFKVPSMQNKNRIITINPGS